MFFLMPYGVLPIRFILSSSATFISFFVTFSVFCCCFLLELSCWDGTVHFSCTASISRCTSVNKHVVCAGEFQRLHIGS